jgi:5-methylcytosine-specific restriction endonuclease McrA
MTGDNVIPNGAGIVTCRACKKIRAEQKRAELATDPARLELVRASERERLRKYRPIPTGINANAAKTHCPYGHPYAGDNLYVSPAGVRQCKACRKVRVMESYYRNHEKRLAEKTAWREENRELHNERSRRWAKENPEKANMISRLKKQRKRAAGVLTEADWNLVLEIYGDACLKCGKPEVTIDHIVPVVDGGTNSIGNVQPLCGSCNSSKGPTFADYRPFPIENVLGDDYAPVPTLPEPALTLF